MLQSEYNTNNNMNKNIIKYLLFCKKFVGYEYPYTCVCGRYVAVCVRGFRGRGECGFVGFPVSLAVTVYNSLGRDSVNSFDRWPSIAIIWGNCASTRGHMRCSAAITGSYQQMQPLTGNLYLSSLYSIIYFIVRNVLYDAYTIKLIV